jgi:periplasmic mercuric ion binding protein
MRKLAFSLACLSILAAGCTPPAAPTAPNATPAKPAAAPAGGSGTTSQATPATGSEEKVQLVAFRVPDMSCPHACWPKVKKSLESQGGVESVELAKQSDADSIDNPVVYLHLNGNFDQNAAIAALDKAGFSGTELVKN